MHAHWTNFSSRALRRQAQVTLEFSRQHQLLKQTGRIDLVFTRLIDYANEVVCFSIRVIQKSIQLSALNGRGIACVLQARCKTLFSPATHNVGSISRASRMSCRNSLNAVRSSSGE